MSFWPSDTAGQIADVIAVGTVAVPLWKWLSPKARDWAATRSLARRRKRVADLRGELDTCQHWRDSPALGVHGVLHAVIVGLICLALSAAGLFLIILNNSRGLVKVVLLGMEGFFVAGMAGGFAGAYEINRDVLQFPDYRRKMLTPYREAGAWAAAGGAGRGRSGREVRCVTSPRYLPRRALAFSAGCLIDGNAYL